MGEERLRQALRDLKLRKARADDPEPYDDAWGWWIDKRLAAVEARLKWILGLALATLAAQILRIALETVQLPL